MSFERCFAEVGFVVFRLDSKGATVGIPSGTAWKNRPENLNEKCLQTLDAQPENLRNYLVFQRNMISAHKHAAGKEAPRDPHDEIAPQKLREPGRRLGNEKGLR